MAPKTPEQQMIERAKALRLHGILAHWEEIEDKQWIEQMLCWEEQERTRRSLERRLSEAHIGRFKPMSEFDWSWPTSCDRGAINALMSLEFIPEAGNVVLLGSNGVGKTMIARNIAYQAVIAGYTALFVNASTILAELASQDSERLLQQRFNRFTRPRLLVIDELGYLSYSTRYADLLFELVSRRYEKNSIIITTNRPFSEWGEVFPSAACVVSLIDRLLHNAEVLAIDGESYRYKEAQERRNTREAKRKSPSKKAKAES
ncbi:mobile element protein [Halorhodospira halochloris]|uniref:Mobile element protein n=1 Tax=Halorhodospira halochloris TaxID=1052 RepID=A0A0X8XAY3_HALHR|nr:IS21-like element helper ATPase IstB [Halorhodospira halochloris]BAU58666.2 mobile element protein [Halorhodospira halochloris]